MAAKESEDAFLAALQHSQECSRELETSLSQLAAAAASPWIVRRAPAVSSVRERERDKERWKERDRKMNRETLSGSRAPAVSSVCA